MRTLDTKSLLLGLLLGGSVAFLGATAICRSPAWAAAAADGAAAVRFHAVGSNGLYLCDVRTGEIYEIQGGGTRQEPVLNKFGRPELDAKGNPKMRKVKAADTWVHAVAGP